ncbi:MAG: histidine phosphatase family protein [Caulobacterales bacterium]|nr:histidine phosphatase family protein [Caulobacterales bacterium]
MRQLILMRHAEAQPSSESGDVGRALTPRGLEDAGRMGQALAERGARPDHALVSAAQRAQQTWDAACTAFGDVVVEIERALYDADSATLRDRIEAIEDDCGSLMLVAHNPAIHRLAVDLLVDQAAAPSTLERLSGGFPPGSVVIYTADSSGRLAYDGFLRPSDLA